MREVLETTENFAAAACHDYAMRPFVVHFKFMTV
jgi:hypothetical protein